MSELQMAREIDRICRAFEREWDDYQSETQIEHWVQQVSESIQPELRLQLMLLDAQFRAQRNNEVSTFDIEALLAEQSNETSRVPAQLESNGQRAQDIRGTLLACPTFAGLSVQATESLGHRLRPMEIEPQSILIQANEPAEGLFLITSGQIDVIADTPDGPQVLDRCGSGSLLGEMSLLTGSKCTATVIAATHVTSLRLSVKDYQTLREQHPEIEIAISQLVSDRLGGRRVDALHGKELGGYRVLECIGRGGMGVVYRALSTAGDRAPIVSSARPDLALKMLRHRFIYDQDAVKHFKREGDLLVGIHHPNLINIVERFLAFRTRFLVMECCQGKDLSQHLAKHGPFPENQIRALLGQIAAGLIYLHQHQILHLDLKPANLMLATDGTIKITDFGLCRLLNAEPTTVVRGTPAYMAPEQLMGEPVEEPTDWYAFGCVAYELVTGRRCFPNRNLMGVAMRKSTFDPKIGWPEWPTDSELGQMLAQALHPELNERKLDLAKIASWAAPVEGPVVS